MKVYCCGFSFFWLNKQVYYRGYEYDKPCRMVRVLFEESTKTLENQG